MSKLDILGLIIIGSMCSCLILVSKVEGGWERRETGKNQNIFPVTIFTRQERLRKWHVRKNLWLLGRDFAFNEKCIYPQTRKSSCVNARGIPPARGRKMLIPPHRLDLTPPIGWLTWPPPSADWPDPPPPADWPDRPPHWLTDLTPPLLAGPDPPISWLTWPPPSVGWLTWPPPRLTPPPRCGLTNKVKLLPSRRTTYAGGKYRSNV